LVEIVQAVTDATAGRPAIDGRIRRNAMGGFKRLIDGRMGVGAVRAGFACLQDAKAAQ
jgi:hypothetical protein